ncbi:hypothetical protein K438DRAFT_1962814 [Mycena galopus ATCC 62051]|nr:hypothetical protein K438DRAFT_1962814 [Mycena galopus ATCC 62051]
MAACISALPEELLVRIIELVVSGCPTNHYVALRVCSMWRRIVENEPACNRDVHFVCIRWNTYGDALRWLAFTLRRCLLSIERSKATQLDFHVFVQPLGLWNLLSRAVLRDLAALVQHVAPRARSLRVQGDPRVLVPILDAKWPLLCEVVLHTDEDPSDTIAGCPAFDAPLLTSFCSSFLSPRISACVLYRRNLTSLELFTSRKPAFLEASRELFLLILRHCPLIERLVVALDDIVLPQYSAPIVLPCLRQLLLTSSHPPSERTCNSRACTSTVWTYFEAPSLDMLAVPHRWFAVGPIGVLNKFFAGRFPSIIVINECPAASVEAWRAAIQREWPGSIVVVESMADYGGI